MNQNSGIFAHDFPFDPAYGYDLDGLLHVGPPPEPPGFVEVWEARYRAALAVDPAPRLSPAGRRSDGIEVFDLAYRSTDDVLIQGWLLQPAGCTPDMALIYGHGYGGVEQPDFPLPRRDAVHLIPCFRGLCRSARAPISTDPRWHILHDLDKPDRYILRGCVEDLWCGVSAVLRLFPRLGGHIGYLGISFGGGIGALALPWEPRIARAHLNVPTFGHQPLRQRLPTTGSGASVQDYLRDHPDAAATLAYYDAAVAARHIHQPLHLTLALFDPVVPPPGQFAIHNAVKGQKVLFPLPAGHYPYPQQTATEQRLLMDLSRFFAPLSAQEARAAAV
jgi:cephalosporin-C deacetylase